MRAYELTDAMRADWPFGKNAYHNATRSGTVAVATCGADGAPAAPAALSGITNLLKYVSGEANVISSFRTLPTKSFRYEVWFCLTSADWAAGGIFYLGEIYCHPGGTEIVRLNLNCFHNGTGWRLRVSLKDDTNTSKAYYSVGASAATDFPAPDGATWYKAVCEWELPSAPGESDGRIKGSVYDETDTLIYGSELTNIGGVYNAEMEYIDVGVKTHATNRTLWLADMALYDDATPGVDLPGLISPIIHSPDAAAGTVRMRLYTDRQAAAVVTYGPTLGTEQTATQVSCTAADDGTWIQEHLLTGLAADTYYKYQITLTDGLDEQTYSSWTGDADEFKFMPFPAPTRRIGVVGISDHHSRYYFTDREPVERICANASRGGPHLSIFTGDNIDVMDGETKLVSCRLDIRYSLQYLSRILSRTVAVWCPGNHDYGESTASAAVKAYMGTALPWGWGAMRSFEFGPLHVIATNEAGYADAATYLAAITGTLTPLLAASTAPWRIVAGHGDGIDCDAATYGSGSTVQIGANDDDLHAALQTAADTIYLHGHLHRGQWWHKDGVYYVMCPPLHVLANKNSTFTVCATPADREGDSLTACIADYGGENGAAGWVRFDISPNWMRVRIFDSYVDAGGVWQPRKRFEQWRVKR